TPFSTSKSSTRTMCGCLRQKVVHFLVSRNNAEHFDGCLTLEINMLASVYFGKTSSSKQAYKAILAKLFSHKIGHLQYPLPARSSSIFSISHGESSYAFSIAYHINLRYYVTS